MVGVEAVVMNRLCKWARWKFDSGVNLGFKGKSSFMALTPSGGVHNEAFDSGCVETNDAVDSLPALHRELIRHEYLVMSNQRQDEKAELFGVSKRTYRNWMKDAHLKLAQLLNIRLDNPGGH